jgi:hypothetical protein
MPKRSRKKKAPDFNQIARSIVDQVTGTSAPKKKPAPNKAKPPRPTKKRDVADIERADDEGMAQPQGLPPKKKRPAKKAKDPAAVSLGRKGGLKGGPARAAKLSKAELSESARKAAQARWAAPEGD